MNNLPYDVVFLIAKKLELLHLEDGEFLGRRPPKFAQYAAINKTWNLAIEPLTFHTLYVFSPDIPEHARSSPITTTRFEHMMKRDPDRRKALPRKIVFHASHKFALGSDEAHSDEGQRENDEAFSRSVRAFWKVLESWRAVPCHSHLDLDLRRVSITPLPTGSRSEAYLNLVGGPLPPLRCVSGFSLDNHNRLRPPTLGEITASLQGLRNADMHLHGEDTADAELSRRHRQELQTIINDQLPSTCLDLTLASTRNPTAPASTEPAVIFATPDDGPLIASLHHLSTRLRSLDLTNIRLSPALFWPFAAAAAADDDDENEQREPPPPSWPHLETIRLAFELRPRHPHGDDPAAHIPAINALAAAAGRAARGGAGMPLLRQMRLELAVPPLGEPEFSVGWRFCFARAGDSGTGTGTTGSFVWESDPFVPFRREVAESWGFREVDHPISVKQVLDWFWTETEVPWRRGV